MHYPFLVTNKHVIEDAETGTFWFHGKANGDLMLGSPVHVALPQFADRFFLHPDLDVDIAVMEIGNVFNELNQNGKEFYCVFLGADLIPSNGMLQELDAIEEVVFIGYPNGLFDTHNYLPIARRGHTATPIQLDYQGKALFLIDAAVFDGSSGSPVFVVNVGGYANRGGFTVGSRAMLLGVLSGGHYRDEFGDFVRSITLTPEDRFRVRQMINLGIVEKSKAIDDAAWLFLESEGVARPNSLISS